VLRLKTLTGVAPAHGFEFLRGDAQRVFFPISWIAPISVKLNFYIAGLSLELPLQFPTARNYIYLFGESSA
jgi:hypothetical protein